MAQYQELGMKMDIQAGSRSHFQKVLVDYGGGLIRECMHRVHLVGILIGRGSGQDHHQRYPAKDHGHNQQGG